jgi:hypothetical protein
MNEESVLREIARLAIATGALPSRPPQQTWGGPGTGAKCALCQAHVNSDELEFEVEFEFEFESGSERYHLHLTCYSAWDAERKAQRKRGTAVSADTAREKSSTAQRPKHLADEKSYALPEHRGDGKITEHGVERAYKPGAA